MTIDAIRIDQGRGASRRSQLLAWVWPDPRRQDERRTGWAWMSGLLGWMWPSAIHDERYGRRHGLMALLFGWAWPQEFDSAAKRFWRRSWLWSWMWPGRVMGPDGEICPLAPWHPAARPEICAGEPWQRKVGRHGGMIFMMFAATAIAAPTFMEGNGALDGGRLSLFHGGAADGGAQNQTPTGEAGGEGSRPGGGEQGGSGGGDPSGPQTGGPSSDSAPGAGGSGDPGPGDGGSEGGFGGGDPPAGGDPSPTGDPEGPGTTFLDTGPGGGDDLAPGPELGFPLGGGGGGGSGGGGSGGGGSGGGGGGGDPPSGGDPFTPPGPNPGGDPTGPVGPPTLPDDKPNLPPGGGGNPGGGDLLIPFDPPGDGQGDPQDPASGTGPAAVPEPGTWALMILGFGLAGYAIRRRWYAADVR